MQDQRLINAKELLSALTPEIARESETSDCWSVITRLLARLPDEQLYLLQQAMDYILMSMESYEASDLDFGGIGCNGQVWLRIHSKKCPDADLGSYTIDECDVLLLSMLLRVQIEELWEKRQLHFMYELATPSGAVVRFRATMYFEMNHLALSLRRINTSVRPFKDLGLHKSVSRLMSMEYQKRGLILITGISGSGKSSTLDSIIDANNRMSHGHIVMIADPIEFVHVPQKCVIRQREIGRDVRSFEEGVIQALRQDPDIIVIGEMRDADTFSAVLEAADTGHKIFATLHTSSAVESIDRILGETSPVEQGRIRERLANLLTCVISQKLVNREDGKLCLVKEVMVSNAPVRAAIRNNNTEEIYQIIHQSNGEGMRTMEQDLAELYNSKVISNTEAMNHANNKKRLEDLIHYQRQLD
ncbi:MAG: type IV pilus twitching motility protein PilT [bacterium]